MQQKGKVHIQKIVLDWYGQNGRDLPWRHTDDLYRIAVSEIMLQQTNVPKVIEKYKAFLKRFPDVGVLARARQSTVLREWQGLGYNRRALNLHKMAKIITSTYDGAFPETEEELGALPGIGPYTRCAILAFGRNRDVSAIDVNIERLIRRLYGYTVWPEGITQEDLVALWVPLGRSRDWHNALMDLASLHCTKKSPKCLTCPLQGVCKSYPAPQEPLLKKRKEKGRSDAGKHTPQRIYRGRIIEHLRTDKANVDMIGRSIKSDWSDSDRDWLEKLLHELSGEGMIKQSKSVWQLK